MIENTLLQTTEKGIVTNMIFFKKVTPPTANAAPDRITLISLSTAAILS